MKKSIWAIIAIVIIIILLVLVSKNNGKQAISSQPIKIGAVFALTGYGANWAENNRDAAQLAVKEINASGGVLGRQLELDVQDNASTQKGTVEAANKLLSQEGVKFILTGWAEHTEPMLALFDQNKAVGVGVSTGNPSLSEKNQYFFNVWPRDAFLTNASVNYMKSKGYKKVAIFNTIGSWENSVISVISSQIAQAGLVTADTEAVDPTSKDYKTQIAKIKASNPDIIYIQALEPNAGLFVRQARQLRLNVPVMYGTSLDPEMITAAGGINVLEGTVYPIYKAPAESFQKAFQAAYNRPAGVSADTAYDAVAVLAQAIKNAGSDDVEKVRAELSKTKDFAGVSGNITFDQTRNRGGADVVLMIVKNGKQIPLVK
ncbi:MAG: hypothetical protein JWO73_651 [Candidatus Taylorbacteria bacterium]|nr:hypothetical protein [Candidatus Taylorbacteria bacterium]